MTPAYSVRKGSRRIIFDILCNKSPLKLTPLYELFKQESPKSISYQGVRKIVKNLEGDGCFELTSKGYQINPTWLEEVSILVNQARRNYQKEAKLKIVSKNKVQEAIQNKEIEELFESLVPILKQSFKKHNIFKKNDTIIINYLRNIQNKGKLIVLSKNNKPVSCVLIVKEESIEEDNFSRWSLKHFACAKELSEQEILNFLQQTQRIIKNFSKGIVDKVKIRYDISEHEKKWEKIFLKENFIKESTLYDHFRPGEKVFLYSKTLRF